MGQKLHGSAHGVGISSPLAEAEPSSPRQRHLHVPLAERDNAEVDQAPGCHDLIAGGATDLQCVGQCLPRPSIVTPVLGSDAEDVRRIGRRPGLPCPVQREAFF